MAVNRDAIDDGKTVDEPLLKRQKEQQLDVEQQLLSTKINYEQITLIWLDSHVVDAGSFIDDVRLTKEILRELNDYVLLFDNESECLANIASIKSETVLLVVSASYASSNLFDKIHNMRHVDSIFIFCQRKTIYESLLLNKSYRKLAGIFTEQTSLALSIQRAIELINRQSTIFALYNTDKQKSMRDLSRESGSFIFLQLVKQVIKQMSSKNGSMVESKQEMIDKCRLYYHGNKKEMENIDEFEAEYEPDQAIKWYTGDSFVYKIINKALRTEDINALYTYRFYIVDLYACLAEHCQLLREVTLTVRVYRGMKMSKAEIERLRESIGHLISVNGYFSTSRERSVAEMYAGIEEKNLVSISVDFESMIFDIDVNLDMYSEVIMADVRHLSVFGDEDEVLFDLGTVFEIKSLYYDAQNRCWICQMTASDKGHAIAMEYLDFKQNELNKSLDIEVAFGDLLHDMGEWVKSRIYFENLGLRRPDDPQIHFGIARSHHATNESDQALSHLKQAYDLAMGGESEWLALAAKICYCASRVHYIRNNFDDALAFSNEALEFYRRIGENGNQSGIAHVLMNIGFAHFLKCDHDASLMHFQRALQLFQHVYPFDHPDKSGCLCYLAYAYFHKGEYKHALPYIIEGSAGLRQLLPKDHPNISSIDSSIGKLFYKQEKYEEALERLRRAADAMKERMMDNTRSYAVILNNFGKILYRLNRLDESSAHYESALLLIEKLFLTTSLDHLDFAYTWKNMGEIHLARGNFSSALDLFERARDMYGRIFVRDGDNRDTAKCWHLIGQTHVALGNDAKALEAFEKALKMWKNKLPEHHPDLALCNQSIAKFYVHTKENDKAIDHFQTALVIYEKCLASDHKLLSEIRSKLADLKSSSCMCT